ncbi:hypothetical protein AOL_s00188g171 [Orbilia oligospora ATCC 24927]|uniref:Uncharacterized protein n=1 Tax=Arthrobotrys oligospora (strain ATCC 24927 / CBS 115.81 / DSM 1491) TaxID=756982 RepID=G1XQF9_ARTOA|nr:hypothetical protein AOL_s00188g171 [Orbilia oligospora ATCC 24927]EGX44503.1 hypothetical protein AOL_s00188g171 [Orbilia oligospora ATCC 24927]
MIDYDDEALFAEIARQQSMGNLHLSESFLNSISTSRSSPHGYQSGHPSSDSNNPSLNPFTTGNGSRSTPVIRPNFLGNPSGMSSRNYPPRINRPCDDLMEYLRHEHLDTDRQRPGRNRGNRNASTTKSPSATTDSSTSNTPLATTMDPTTTDQSPPPNNPSIAKDSSTNMNPFSPRKTSPVLGEAKARYRGVSEGPRLPSLEGVPDWYIDAHKEFKVKHPYDFTHFVEGYRFYAEGPPVEANEEQYQEESSAQPEHSYPVSPPYRSTTPMPPIAPLNHPAVDPHLPHFTPPSYGRYRYSEAVSADTFHISEKIEKVRQYELAVQETGGAPTSGSSYVNRLSKSVKYSVLSDEYPTDLLDMYEDEEEDEPQLACEDSHDKETIPEIRVEQPEESSDSDDDLYSAPVQIKEPNKLTVPFEEIPDISDLIRQALKDEEDSRSVGEKSDGSAKGYGDFLDYYSRTSGASASHEGEELDNISIADSTDSHQRSSYHGKDQKHYVPVLTPLYEEQSRTQIKTPFVEYKGEQEFLMPSHPLDESINVIQDVQETATVTSVETETNVQDANTNTNEEKRVPMKPRPAYVEHGPDEYAGRHRSICDGTNFWRDDFSQENGIKDRVIIEKPVTIEKPAPTPAPAVPSNSRVPKPASIVGSDSPPHEIKDTNSLRHPTIIHVEPTSPTPPPVPPKDSITPEFPPTPPPKTAENAYYPSTPIYGPAPHPSMADIGHGMRIEEEDLYNTTIQYKDNFDTPPQSTVPIKAMKRLGIEMSDIRKTSSFESGAFIPFVPYAGSKLEKEVNHTANRNGKLDQDPSKSSKSLLGFRGGVSNLFRKRDKTAGPSKLNTEVPQADKRTSVEIGGTSSPDSPRPGLFKRLFNNKRQSDAPSTAPSIESYGGSHKNHESWDSSRASGDTGLTSNDDTFMSYSPHHSVPDTGKASTENTLSPADYIDNRINPNFNVKLNDKPLKTKRSLFFGRDKSGELEPVIPDVNIHAPKEEKRGSVFGFFQKEKAPRDISSPVEEIKKKTSEEIKKEILEQAEFERSGEFARQQQKVFEEKQKAKMVPGKKGYFNRKGEYFRAKNPLELELCDSECSEPQSFSEVKAKFEQEEQQEQEAKAKEAARPKRWTPEQYVTPLNPDDYVPQPEPAFGDHDIHAPIVEEPETIASESLFTSHESVTVKSPVQPGFSPKNEPPSHWSDDSDMEDNEGSQPPTPSNPSFGRSGKTHKRSGSGSSNLGSGPMFMKKAVRKFKANRKSAEVRTSPSMISKGNRESMASKGNRESMASKGNRESMASKGNRDSVISQNSNGSSRNTTISTSVPPVPAPPVPTRGSTDAGVRPEARASRIPVPKVSVSSPSSRLTTGTYHDQNENVVHHFGGTIPERSGSSLGHRGDRTSMPANLPERSKSSLGHNVGSEKFVRDGIRCTADITPQDVKAWNLKKDALDKANLEEEQRKKRKEEFRIKEAEAKLKREKVAAKADYRLEKERKRQDAATEKSKFRIGLATRLADRLVQRETNSLKGKGVLVPAGEIDENNLCPCSSEHEALEKRPPPNEPWNYPQHSRQAPWLKKNRPWLQQDQPQEQQTTKPTLPNNGATDFKYCRTRATFGCGPDDPPLAIKVTVPDEETPVWNVPEWVMESKGPEWVYQWQHQGIYPENPFYPPAVKRNEDGLFDSPLFRCLLDLGDFNGVMYWLFQQLRHEIDKTEYNLRARGAIAHIRLREYEDFVLKVEGKHDRERYRRDYIKKNKLKDPSFNPLEDLNDKERQRELKYAAQQVAGRKAKLLKLLGHEASTGGVLREDALRRDILTQRHFERQFEQYKMEEFSKQIAEWMTSDALKSKYMAEEDERIKRQATRTHKDTILVAYRDFLGLVFPPEWLQYSDIDLRVDPAEVRELGMYTAEIRARKRAVIEAGENVEYNLEQINNEDPQRSFWFEVESIYRHNMANHLGMAAEELGQQMHERLKLPEGPNRYNPQFWNSIFDPAGDDWPKEKAALYNFNTLETEKLVTECKDHHIEVQKLEEGIRQLLKIEAFSDASRAFMADTIRSQMAGLQKEWKTKRSLIMELGFREWQRNYDPKYQPTEPSDSDVDDYEVELDIARMRMLQQALEMEGDYYDDDGWLMTKAESAAFAEADISAHPDSPAPGLGASFRQGLADSESLLGGAPSGQRRKMRTSVRESFGRPYGRPNKPNSKPRSKQQSRPKNFGLGLFDDEKSAATGGSTGNSAARRQQSGPQPQPFPPSGPAGRQRLTAGGRTAGRGSMNLDLWPDFSEVLRPEGEGEVQEDLE